MKAIKFFVISFIALAPVPTTAADFSQVDLRPYILFSSHLAIPTIGNPTELTFQEQQQFITQGGATFSSRVIQVEQQVPSSDVYRGIATPAQLTGLRNELNRAKIRAQRSCEIPAEFQMGYIDLTWNSILGRRNSFRVVYARAGTSGLSQCREAMIQILAHLREFESDVLQNPDTEVLRTPP